MTAAPEQLTVLPRRLDGRVDWKTFYSGVKSGDQFRIQMSLRFGCSGRGLEQLFSIHTRGNHDGTFTLIIGEPKPKVEISDQFTGPYHGLTKGDITLKIREAEESIRYWTFRKVTTTRPGDRTQAGARVLLWQGQLRNLRAHYNTLVD